MSRHLDHPPAASAGWVPSSPCTPGCLPAAAGAGRLRVAVRFAALVAVLLAALGGVPLLPARRRERWLRACSGAALRAAGIRLRIGGDARFAEPGTGVLVVANHLSWIDVLALGAVQPVRMLAKREVRDWPLLGGLATRTGALFVDRSGLRTLPATVAGMAAALRSGSAVGVFPEGTTWCGAAAGTFRRAAFQAAIDAGVAVRPVAIALRLADGTPARGAAFVGDQTLADSLLRVLRLPALVCELSVLPAVPPSVAGDRRALAREAAERVAAVTGVRHGARPPAIAPVGVGSAGVGSVGVGSAGVGSAGVGSAGVGSAGVGSAGVGEHAAA